MTATCWSLTSIFKKENFDDLISVSLRRNTSSLLAVVSNDNGKVKVLLTITFTSAPAGSQEPEAFLSTQSDKGELGNFTFERMVVRESVPGGVTLGDWVGRACELCCGQRLSQNRTCTPSNVSNCDGVITNRTIACQWKCPLKCGTGTPDTTVDLFMHIKKIFSKASTAYKETVDSITLTNDNGYIRVSFVVLFGEPPSNPNDPEALFRYKTENGELGKFKIDIKKTKVDEETYGYRFSDWTNKKDGCDKCCGGELSQTRMCTSDVGKCTNAQVERKIKCKHVCDEVQCSGML
ncbi:hypothetical protein QZH41_014538 [Actinostola sp. cb2023]|nr:hypothetical protein QZH41_014538 [Actinostola sp. cb2023]